jgi:hypothetical protein
MAIPNLEINTNKNPPTDWSGQVVTSPHEAGGGSVMQ